MALRHAPNDWITTSVSTKRATIHKAPARSGFSSRYSGAWSAAIVYPVKSTAESALLNGVDVLSCSDATTTQDPPHLHTCTSLLTCSDQHFRPFHSVRYRATRPAVPRTVHRSRTPQCSSIPNAGQELGSTAGLTTSTPGRRKKPEWSPVDPVADLASVSTDHGQDTSSCRHCSKSFATRSTLLHHEISHDPVKAHKYHCTKCQIGFRYPKDLKRHSSTHRQAHESGNYSCPVCQKTFWRRDNLRRHQRSTSHLQESIPADAVDSPDAFEQSSRAGTEDADLTEQPAKEYDQDTRTNQSRSGSSGTSVNPATGSQFNLPSRPTPGTSATKRARRPSSDGDEGSGEDGQGRKRSRRPRSAALRVACPFVGCRVICSRSISTLLRHIKQVHSSDICNKCIKPTSMHQHLGCQEVCASPRCPNIQGQTYHNNTTGCVRGQRHEEVAKTKYKLLCQLLRLAPKAFIYDSELHCPDCQAKDNTIELLSNRIRSLTAPAEEGGALPLQNNIAQPSDFMTGAYSQPTSRESDPFDPLGQYRQNPMIVPQQSFVTAPSSNSHQATELDSFTLPSFQGTSPTYLSHHDTQTETSMSLQDNDVDTDTPKFSHAEPFSTGLSNDEEGLFDYDSGFNAILRAMGGPFDEALHRWA